MPSPRPEGMRPAQRHPPRARIHPALVLAVALVGSLGAAPPCAAGEEVRILVQSSPLAGSQYYAVARRWQVMAAGDELQLVREADNAHDPNAVRVDWRGEKLGYLPRAENRAVAAALDHGERVAARIKRLTRHRNPWARVEVEVFLLL